MTDRDPISEPLNAWLDGFVQGRIGTSPAGRELEGVTETAETFHRLAREGERYASATSPMARRWEDVMHTATIPVSRTPVASPTASPNRRVMRFVPGLGDAGHLAAILAVMVLVGALFAHLSPGAGEPGNHLALVPPNGQATPASDDGWLTPVDPAECTVAPRSLDEIGAIMADPGEWPERQYLPVGPADPTDAEEAALAFRMWYACYNAAFSNAKRAMETPRYMSEISEYRFLGYENFTSFAEWKAASEELRLAYSGIDPDSLFQHMNTQPGPGGPARNQVDARYGVAVEPKNVRLLPDGRLVGLVTHLFPADVDLSSPHDPDSYGATEVLYFAPDPTRDNAWAVDQRFTLCVINCDNYYQAIQNDRSIAWESPPSAATPDDDETAWLTPVDPAECTVEPRSLDEIGTLMRDPGEWPERQYLPTSPAEPNDAVAAAETHRVWEACYLAALPYEKREVETPRYISEVAEYSYLDYANFSSFDDWKAAHEAVSMAYAPDDPSSLFRHTSELDASGEIMSFTVDPANVRSLPDGRLVALLTTLYAENAETPLTLYPDGPWLADVIFFAPDPTRNGTWAVDQRLSSVCVYSCNLLYDMVAQEAWYHWPDSPGPATPPGTPMTSTPSSVCTESSWFVGTNPAPYITDPALQDVPWMEAETTSSDVTVLGLHLNGTPPLPVGGAFPDTGKSAEVVWVTSEYVSQFRVTARTLDDPGAPLVYVGAVPEGEVNDTGMIWRSIMNLPTPGCWEIAITANPVDGGEPLVARVFVPVTPLAPGAATLEASPEA